jgi:hypothetical protein
VTMARLITSALVALLFAPQARAQDSCDALNTKLQELYERLTTVSDDAFTDARCSDALVLCLGWDGGLLRSNRHAEAAPASLRAGETLSVTVVSPSGDQGELVTGSHLKAANSTLFQASAPAPEKTNGGGGGASMLTIPACVPSESSKLMQTFGALKSVIGQQLRNPQPAAPASDTEGAWQQWSGSIASALLDPADRPYAQRIPLDIDVPDGTELTVSFQRKLGTATRPVVRHRIPIESGRYFADVGIMLPVVFGGDRHFYAVEDPGVAGERRVRVDNDVRFSAVAMLEVFPFGGRARNRVWAWDGPNPWASFVGLQAGTSVSAPAKEFYFGLALEPVSGISFDVGVAAVKTWDFAKGWGQDDLVPRGSTVPVRERYLARPYLGMTLSLEVYNMLTKVKP